MHNILPEHGQEAKKRKHQITPSPLDVEQITPTWFHNVAKVATD
jgi:hypothetical protein